MKYGIDATWYQLREDAGALELVKKILPQIAAIVEVAPNAQRISFRTLRSYAPGKISEVELLQLDEALKRYGVNRGLTEGEKKK